MPTIDRLFIAEKPAAAKTLADFLVRSTGAKATSTRTHIVVGADAITWQRGHLLELVDAEHYNAAFAKWRIDDLPIIPQPFELVPRKGRDGKRAEAAAHIKAIAGLVKECKVVVGFCDPDAEGQMIQDELLEYIKSTKPVLRLWANALDDSTLTKALSRMAPNEDYRGYYEQALCRSHSDWLYGINMTRACTLHAQAAGASGAVYIGRVQTPTLALIVRRELEIQAFKAVDYYVPHITLSADPGFRATWSPKRDAKGDIEDPRVNQDGLLTDAAVAKGIVDLARTMAKAKVISAQTKPGTESAPLTFSQSGLQALCSQAFGLGASRTLEIAQSLYEKKLTSYPRVDTEYLPEDQHAEAPKVLASLAKAALPSSIGKALVGARPSLRSRAWNDKLVTAHHGIIPTHLDNPAEVARLSPEELKVYLEIVKRYVLQFYPAAKFLSTELILGVQSPAQSEVFTAKGRRYTEDGWRKAFSEAIAEPEEGAEAVATLPQLTDGQMLPVAQAGCEAKKTKPKKRFTEGTLITAMKNIHEYVSDPEIRKGLKEGAGIGTEATRAKIIDVLMDPKRGLVRKEGKELVPTENGIRVIQLLPEQITTPDTTAVWQQFGNAVQARETDYKDFMTRQVKWIRSLVASASGFFSVGQFPADPNGKGGRPGGAGSNRPRPVDTEHQCFGKEGMVGCGAFLRLLSGQYGLFYKCTNAECGKTFRHVDGKPVEKLPAAARTASSDVGAYSGASFKCQKCEPGKLLKKARRDGSGHFWGCSHWREADGGCRAAYNDHEGKPDFEGVTRQRSGGGAGHGGRSGGMGSANAGGFRPKPLAA